MAIDLQQARTDYLSEDEEVRRAAVAQLDAEQRGALGFLVDAMGDVSWRVRKEAAARASHWIDRPYAATVLTDALSEPDNVGRRNAAIEALVALGGESVLPLVRSLERRPEHRKVLVDTLGLIADPAGAAPLEPLLDDPDPNVRVAAAESLGNIGGVVAQSALRRAIHAWKGELLLTLAALDGLNRTGARLSLPELEPLAQHGTLRAAVLEALGRTADPYALPILTRALADPGRSVREAATRAIADLHARLDAAGQKRVVDALSIHAGGVQALVQALLEGSLSVQRAAALVLGLTRRVEAVRPLVLALGDPEMRESAMAALVSIGPPGIEALVTLAPDLEGRLRADVYSILPHFVSAAADARIQAQLGEALEDEDVDAAAGAAQALGELGGREALAPLLRALEREDSVAQAAAGALGKLGQRHYDEVRILVASRGLHGPDAPYLCRVLGVCGREGDAQLLRSALGGDSAAVRRAAADALSQLPRVGAAASGATEIDEALLFALADESAEVRAAAARALGAHGRNLSAQTTDALERAARDLEVAVRVAAARALGQVALKADGPQAPERGRALIVLRKLADAPEVVAAVPALEALGEIGDPSDDERLVSALQASDAEVVKAAARALGARRETLSAAQARAALERALSDSRWDVRRVAAQALGQHGPTAHPMLYARRTVEKDSLVLEAIDEAMGAAMEPRRR